MRGARPPELTVVVGSAPEKEGGAVLVPSSAGVLRLLRDLVLVLAAVCATAGPVPALELAALAAEHPGAIEVLQAPLFGVSLAFASTPVCICTVCACVCVGSVSVCVVAVCVVVCV